MDELAAPTDPGRAGRLPRSRRVAGALIGLAVTVALVLALLAIAGGRVAQAPLAPTQGIDWQSATRVAAGRWDFGPFLASAGGRLFMVGQGHSTATPSGSGIVQSIGPITVWSSADGLTWDQVSEPGSFEASTSRFSPLAFSDDGNGGLIVVGNTAVGNDLQPAMAWHSSDGRTWTQEQIASDPAQVLGVAARSGAVVALGQLVTSTSVVAGEIRSATELAAWYSADGIVWSQAILPDSAGYLPSAVTAWKDGFAAVAYDEGPGTTDSTAWTSTDGRTWEKAPTQLTGFGASAMTALGDRVVVVGSVGLSPASWSSTDGRAWVELMAPARDPATAFSDVTIVGEFLVGIGVSQQTLPASAPPSNWTPPPPPLASVWVSTDGLTWRLLAEDPSLTFGGAHNTYIANSGDRIVVATQGANAVEVFVGDLVK